MCDARARIFKRRELRVRRGFPRLCLIVREDLLGGGELFAHCGVSIIPLRSCLLYGGRSIVAVGIQCSEKLRIKRSAGCWLVLQRVWKENGNVLFLYLSSMFC